MKEWLANMSAGLVGGLIASLALVLVLAWQADRIAELTLHANPTCEDPTGLAPVPDSAIASATGPMENPGFSPAKAIDGFGGSIWVPPMQSDSKHPIPRFVAGQDTLTLTLKEPHDVVLVCVVNGLANSFTNYENWGRVRTVAVKGDAGVETLTSMKSLGNDSFPNAQLAAKGVGVTATIAIRLVDSYTGQTEEEYDPDVCFKNGDEGVPRPAGMMWQPRFAQGCIVNATRWAGLADVFLYEPSPPA